MGITDKPCLPFPCIPQTTPVTSITDFHDEDDPVECRSYYFYGANDTHSAVAVHDA